MTGINIEGEVVKGLQAAGIPEKGTLALQRPCFEEAFPEMRNWLHWSTINLKLALPMRIQKFDFETKCAWQGPGVEPEKFGFLRIEIEFPIGGNRRPALIYVPHNSPHFPDASLVEVLTSKIEGINYGVRCLIHIARAQLVIV
jgi:hypothetical protein